MFNVAGPASVLAADSVLLVDRVGVAAQNRLNVGLLGEHGGRLSPDLLP